MSIIKQIPNLITGLNLISGCIAILQIFEGKLYYAAIFILLGAFFDFFDGLSARLLKVSSEMGKQMDSLADMVTFGIAPTFIVYKLIEQTELSNLKYIALVMAFFSAFRLAKFNIDTRQSTSFIGLPTPANALFWLSIPLSINYSASSIISDITMNPYFLSIGCIVFSILLVSEIPMFSLKIKSLSIKENKIQFSFLFLSVILISFFSVQAISIIILLYIIYSTFISCIKKKLKLFLFNSIV